MLPFLQESGGLLGLSSPAASPLVWLDDGDLLVLGMGPGAAEREIGFEGRS